VSESALMSSPRDHARRSACRKGFLPAGRAQAPTITWLQTGKAEIRRRGRQIIPARFEEVEKLRGHHGADRVTAHVLYASVLDDTQ
jgi:hypothetical protein